MGLNPKAKWVRDAVANGSIDASQLPGSSPARRPAEPPGPPLRRLAIEVEVAVRTVSEANTGGKLPAKLARKAAVKAAVGVCLPDIAEPLPLPLLVTLTRVSGGKLDDDNLRPALKVVRDVVAGWLGVDDAHPRVKWRYRQRPGWSPAVVIRVEHTAEG